MLRITLSTLIASYLCAGAFAGTTVNKTIESGGRNRTFTVYVPDSYSADSPTPLVLNLHGTRGTSSGQAAISQMNAVADTEGFLIAYPQAVMSTASGVQWNTLQLDDQVNDIEFLSGVIDQVGSDYQLDATRVYSTGFSNGGSMTYLLGHVLPDRIAAIAPMSAHIAVRDGSNRSGPIDPVASPTTSRPMPITLIHGTKDFLVPIEGGISPLTGSLYSAADDVINAWVTNNDCNPVPTITELPDTVAGDRSTVELHSFTGCDSYQTPAGEIEADVQFYKIIGGNHQWPGGTSPSPLDDARLQPRNDDITASREIWNFFERHTLPVESTGPRVEFGTPENLGAAFNTSGFEFGLDVSADGNTIYFNRCAPDCDIYQASRPDKHSDWERATPIRELNTSATDVGPSVTADALELYLADEITPTFNAGRFRPGSKGGDIWVSTRTSAEEPWGEPENVAVVNSDRIDAYPTISPDGLELYFSSTREGSNSIYGDIYLANRGSRNEPFGEPTLLPEPINSEGGVAGVELSNDGLSLFFISRRDGGFGDTDLWMSQRSSRDAAWNDPINLGDVVNDQHLNGFPNLSPDARTLYFVSERNGGRGGLDVWSVPIVFTGKSGDFNHDGTVDVIDIDVMGQELQSGSNDFDLDLNGDGVVDIDDRIELVSNFLNTYIGDSNLDGEFNSSDLVAVLQAGEYEDAVVGNSNWATGDWNGDGEFDTGDLVAGFTGGGYEIGPRNAANSVPEPNSLPTVFVALFAGSWIYRRRTS